MADRSNYGIVLIYLFVGFNCQETVAFFVAHVLDDNRAFLTRVIGQLTERLFEGAAQTNIVDGLECRVGDQNDGYFDCSCTGAAQFNASGTDDCFSPGAQAGDLCCDADDTVKKL